MPYAKMRFAPIIGSPAFMLSHKTKRFKFKATPDMLEINTDKLMRAMRLSIELMVGDWEILPGGSYFLFVDLEQDSPESSLLPQSVSDLSTKESARHFCSSAAERIKILLSAPDNFKVDANSPAISTDRINFPDSILDI